MQNICRICKKMQKYAKNMQKYAKNMQNMREICAKYIAGLTNMHQVQYAEYAKNIQNIQKNM